MPGTRVNRHLPSESLSCIFHSWQGRLISVLIVCVSFCGLALMIFLHMGQKASTHLDLLIHYWKDVRDLALEEGLEIRKGKF